MRARLTSGARYAVVQLFSGHVFIKSEWRPIPAQYEAEARVCGWLEIEPTAPVAKKPIPIPIEEPIEEALPLPINAVEWVDVIAEPEPEPAEEAPKLEPVEEIEPAPVQKSKKKGRR